MGFSDHLLISLVGWVLLIQKFLCLNTTCPPPDFPSRGGYEPKKEGYEVGQTVSYYCNSSFIFYAENDNLFAKRKQVTCQPSGKWSGGTPFCAIMTNLIKPGNLMSSMNDGNWDTCFETGKNWERTEFLHFYLKREVDSYSAIFCFGKGKGWASISFEPDGWRLRVNADDVKDKCKVMNARGAYKQSHMLMIVETGPNSAIPICEMAIYKKDDEWCKHPPEVSIPNGQLEVNRSKAVLHCNEGFMEKDGREVYATCENKTWSYLSLQCIDILCQPFLGNVSPEEGEWKSDGISSEHHVGTNMTVSCKPGYQREGEPSTVTCLQNGTWTRTTATCKNILCEPFLGNVSPAEGEWNRESDGISSEQHVGTKMTLSCKPGYQREGEPSTVTCLQNGAWTRTTATCNNILCEPFLENVRPAEGEWKSDGISSEHHVGTRMTLYCKPGYQKECEPSTVTCLQNGTWTTTMATCKKYELQLDYKILAIVIGSVAVIIILALVGVKIFFIPKKTWKCIC